MQVFQSLNLIGIHTVPRLHSAAEKQLVFFWPRQPRASIEFSTLLNKQRQIDTDYFDIVCYFKIFQSSITLSISMKNSRNDTIDMQINGLNIE